MSPSWIACVKLRIGAETLVIMPYENLRTCGGAFGLNDGRRHDLAHGAEQDSKIFRLLKHPFWSKLLVTKMLLHAPAVGKWSGQGPSDYSYRNPNKHCTPLFRTYSFESSLSC